MLSRRKFVAASAATIAAGSTGIVAALASRASATANTLNIDLHNNTGNDTVYAYVTGTALDSGNALFLLQSDGVTPYLPASPSAVGSALGANCAIPIGANGSTRRITIPHLAGARIWFSIGAPLTFLLNPGPALVEPSVTNSSDPNIHTLWDFCELTFNSTELYANISFVDFVSIPIALTSTGSAGTQSAPGLPAGGLDTVCAALTAQNAADGAGWNQLIVTSGGQNLRALSPTNGIVMNPSLLSGYFNGYLDQVWAKYSSSTLSVDTQAQWGTVTGQVSGGVLAFPGVGSFGRPSSADIFSCNSGPFAVSGAEMGALAARISAAMNRTTLLIDSSQPDGENPANYYQYAQTNHYARIVHATCPDHRGYAFPYDDVQPTGGVDQSGAVVDGNPTLLTVTLGAVHGSGSGGGSSASASASATASATPTGTAVSAYSTIQAEAYTAQSGTATETCTDTGGGQDVGWIANGDWLSYQVDFGSGGATQFQARVASGAASGISGLVNVALDNPTATPVSSFAIANTGGWQSWRTVPANMTKVTGVHTVYLYFSSGQPADFVNVNWLTFAAS